MRPINLLVVHCAASTPDKDLGVEDIRRMHKAQGWSDVGYHFVIRRNGRIEKGRDESVVGAHVSGYNANSIGVCLVGGANAKGRGENNFTVAQFESLELVLKDLRKRYPNTRICGHRDLSPDKNKDGQITSNEWIKECPSFEVSDWLKKVGIPQAGTSGVQ